MNVRPAPSQTSQDAEPAPPIYFIGGAEPLPEDVTPAVLGFKAYNLAQMAAIGLNVPPAFVLGTGWCARQEMITPAMWNGGLAHLERATGLRLGDPRKPLLLSVRSGAPVSMPGMMETLLNIGLSDATLARHHFHDGQSTTGLGCISTTGCKLWRGGCGCRFTAFRC